MVADVHRHDNYFLENAFVLKTSGTGYTKGRKFFSRYVCSQNYPSETIVFQTKRMLIMFNRMLGFHVGKILECRLESLTCIAIGT